MAKKRIGQLISLEQRAARLRPAAGLLDKDPAEMTMAEKKQTLRLLRLARGADPDQTEPEVRAWLDSMTPKEKVEALKRIRAARLVTLDTLTFP